MTRTIIFMRCSGFLKRIMLLEAFSKNTSYSGLDACLSRLCLRARRSAEAADRGSAWPELFPLPLPVPLLSSRNQCWSFDQLGAFLWLLYVTSTSKRLHYSRLEILQDEGLGDIADRTVFKRLVHMLLIFERGDHYDLRVILDFSYMAQRHKPIHPLHLYIQENDIRLLPLDDRNRLCAV